MATPVNLSTIGVKFGWGVETTAGVAPSAFTMVQGCISIAGIALTADTIDVTPLESSFRQYVDGIKDTGGTWDLTFNITNVFKTEWDALRTASATATASGLSTWAEVWIPNFNYGFFVKFTPGEIPMPEFAVGSAFQGAVSCTINEYVGLDTAVEPVAAK